MAYYSKKLKRVTHVSFHTSFTEDDANALRNFTEQEAERTGCAPSISNVLRIATVEYLERHNARKGKRATEK